MKHTRVILGAIVALFLMSRPSQAAVLTLFEYGLNINGTVSLSTDPTPSGADISGFDTGTGLGTIVVTVLTPGPNYVGLFLDIEIDEATNTFFNEFGADAGAPAAGQSHEIDEPDFVFGDIFANFSAGTLDGTNGVPAGSPDDVAMALAWDFMGPAKITFKVSHDVPSGFYLSQTDPDSSETIYFSSTRSPLGPAAIPEPASVLVWGALGCVALVAARRRALKTSKAV